MSDTKISDLNSLTKSTIATNDSFPVVDDSTSETKQITYEEVIQPLDSQFRVVGSADTTKKVAFEVDSLTTATTRTLTIQDSNDTIVGRATTDILTNKTLTDPKILLGTDEKGDIFQLADTAGNLNPIRGTSEGDIISWDAVTEQWETIPNPSGSNGSTTVKGVFEAGTLAETIARTTTGGTGANLVVTPENLTTVLTYDYAVDAVGTDSYAITVTPAPVAYVAGQTFTFKAGTANTGACTLNVNTLGAKAIKKNYNSDLVTGDILANQVIQVCYDGTNMQVVSHVSANFVNGTTTKNTADATITQTIAHGLGITPRKIRMSLLTIANGTNSAMGQGVFVYNGTTKSMMGGAYVNGAMRTMAGTDIILYGPASGAETEFQTGVVTIDATNISIAWTKTNSPTGTWTILWEAEV